MVDLAAKPERFCAKALQVGGIRGAHRRQTRREHSDYVDLPAGIRGHLSAPRWNTAAKGLPLYCIVNGATAPVNRTPNAKPINFQVAFPSTWNGRAAQPAVAA